MNTKKKRKKNRIMPMACALGIFIGSVCNSYMNAYAEALPDFVSGSTNVADVVMSYMASAGTFISNRDWIAVLYRDLGDSFGTVSDFVQNNMLTVDSSGNIVATQALEDAIANTPAYGSLGLGELFNVSAQEAQIGGGVAATGAGTLAGAMGGVATSGVLPLAVGVTGAYWGGIALGTLVAHQLGLYGKPILYGYTLDEAFNAAKNDIQLGNAVVTGSRQYSASSVPNMYLMTGEGYGFSYQSGTNTVTIGIFNQNGTTSTGTYWQGTVDGMNQYLNTRLSIGITTNQYAYTANAPNKFNSAEEFNAYMKRWKDGEVTPKKYADYSPDVITPSGNAVGNYDGQELTVPSMTPEVDPTGQSIVPGGASLQDWLRWANGAKGNTNLNDPDSNADIFEEILQALRQNVPTAPGANPNPDLDPDPTPTPTPVPKPDYDPDNPNQPEYDPKETEGPDDVTNGDPWTTPDLLDRFPFCLPRDVFRCFEKLNVNERMAPSISWHFVTPLGIHFDFDLDLDDYEGVAAILRTLELIAFIIGLALATRNLIGR